MHDTEAAAIKSPLQIEDETLRKVEDSLPVRQLPPLCPTFKTHAFDEEHL